MLLQSLVFRLPLLQYLTVCPSQQPVLVMLPQGVTVDLSAVPPSRIALQSRGCVLVGSEDVAVVQVYQLLPLSVVSQPHFELAPLQVFVLRTLLLHHFKVLSSAQHPTLVMLPQG